jgi:uncharacterized Tic20 family protein
MAAGQPNQPGAPGGHTWYGGGNPPPNPTFGQPPGWGAAPGVGGGFAPQGQPNRPSSNENIIAGIAHLSSFFAPLIAPLLIWLLVRDSMPYASRQGKQAFFFHIIISVITGVGALLFVFAFFFLGTFGALAASSNSGAAPGALLAFPLWFLLFFGVILALTLVSQGFAIYAAIQTFQGKPFSYPFLSRL